MFLARSPCRCGGGLRLFPTRPTRHFQQISTTSINTPDDIPDAAAQWQLTEVSSITHASFLDMLHGRIPAVKLPGFVDPEHSKRFEAHLQPLLKPYSHIAGPRVDKVGLAQFEFQAQSAEDFKNRGTDAQDRYFAEVPRLADLHRRIALHTGDNPFDRIVTLLRGLLPEWDVLTAREPAPDGREYHAGIYRSISNSTPIHCDWSPYDSMTENWVINRVVRQAVFNLYLSPMVNGETIIYNRVWNEELLRYRDPQTYGYFREAVKGRSSVVLRPNVGDVYFFNTRSLHEVKSVGWEPHPGGGLWQRPRLTLSAFLGLLPPGILGRRPSLILWS